MEFVSFTVKVHEFSECMGTSKKHKGEHVEQYCLKMPSNLTAQTHAMDWKEKSPQCK